MRMLSPGANMPAADLVMTPHSLAREIIEHFGPRGTMLDPARGSGAFFDQFQCVEKHWCEIREGRSFYSWTTPVDCIITNPPWSQMRKFLNKAYEVADEVIYLSTLTHFLTRARIREMDAAGFGAKEFFCVRQPKEGWPSSGFQLGAMQLVRGYEGPLALTGDRGR